MSDTRSPDRLAGVDVAIVGGGFCGTMTAVHLLERSDRPLSIALIDASDAFARGVAYSTAVPGHLLNVVASKMSARPDVPDDFVRWLDENARDHGFPSIAPDAFAPRKLYGAYLEATLEHARRAGGHARLHRSTDRIDRIERRDGRLLLHARDGGVTAAGAVVIATGNSAPSDPVRADEALLSSGTYLKNPWTNEGARRLAGAREILIVGAGLTGLDAVVAAAAGGEPTAIHVLSRHGTLPLPHASASAPSAERIESLAQAPSLRALMREIRALVRESSNADDWRGVIDAMRPMTAALWRSLGDEDRRRFLRHVRPYWERHRHRAAPSIVGIASRLEAAGILHLHAGRLRSLELCEYRVRATYADRRHGDIRSIDVDIAANCTGPPLDVSRPKGGLIDRLIRDGMAAPDTLALGLAHNSDGMLLDASGRPSQGLFAIGGLRRGSLYESTAVPELRAQASELADALLRMYRSGRRPWSAVDRRPTT